MNIIVIDPVSSGTAYIKAANRLNIDIYILTEDIGERCISPELRACVKSVIKVDTNDYDALKKAIEEIGSIQTILPGVEYKVPICAQLAAEFGLSYLEPVAVEVVRNKYLFRQRLKQHNLSHIQHFVIDPNTHHPDSSMPDEFSFPAVVKPIDMSGSMGVRRVDNLTELQHAVKEQTPDSLTDVGFSSSGHILVEEYISGKEFSVEGIVFNDQVYICSITEKILGPEPYFVELGHIVGKQYEADFKSMISHYSQAVVKAAKVNIGPFHLELRVTEDNIPTAIEMAARLPGDKIVELIKHAYDIDLAELTIQAYVNQFDQPQLKAIPSVSAIAFIPHSAYTSSSDTSFFSHLLTHKDIVTHEIYPQDRDSPLTGKDWSSRIGHFIFSGQDYNEIRNAVSIINTEGSYS